MNNNHFDVSKESDSSDHYVMMGKLIAGETLKVIAKAEKVEDDTLYSKLEIVNYERMDNLPTRDLIYDTIYESRPGTFRFRAEAGEQMVEKLLEMGK